MRNKGQTKNIAALLALALLCGAAGPAAANGRRDIPDPQQPVQSAPSADANGQFPPAPTGQWWQQNQTGAAAESGSGQPPAGGGAQNPAGDNAAANSQPGAAPNGNAPAGDGNSGANSGGAALWPSVAAQQQAAPAPQPAGSLPANDRQMPAAPGLQPPAAAAAAAAPGLSAGAAAGAESAAGSAGQAALSAQEQTIRDLQAQVQILQQRLNALENSRAAGGNAAVPPPAFQQPAGSAAAPSAADAEARKRADDTEAYQVPAGIDADALYAQGQNFMAEGRYAKAELVWQAFGQRFPQDKRAAEAAFNLGESYYARGLYGKAAETYLNVRNRYKDAAIAPQNLLKLALSMKNLQDTNTACEMLEILQHDYRNAAPAIVTQATLMQADALAREMQCP